MITKSDTVTVIRIDTVKITSVVYKPRYISITHRDTIELPAKIDTVYVVRDYYARRYYADTMRDECFKIILKDTISENSIVSRKWDAEVYSKTITKTITNEVEYCGGELWLQGVMGQSYGMGAIYQRYSWGVGALYTINDGKGAISGQVLLRLK